MDMYKLYLPPGAFYAFTQGKVIFIDADGKEHLLPGIAKVQIEISGDKRYIALTIPAHYVEFAIGDEDVNEE